MYRNVCFFVLYFGISFVLLFTAIEIQKGEARTEDFLSFSAKKQEVKDTLTPKDPKNLSSSLDLEEFVHFSPFPAENNKQAEWSASLQNPQEDISPPQEISVRSETSSVYPMTPKITDAIKQMIRSPKLLPYLPIFTINITSSALEPRGQMSKGVIRLTSQFSSVPEAILVFGHELGHIVDIESLIETTYRADQSETFYAISWIGSTIKKKGMRLTDFASGYAMTNQYEDFAESFTFFMFYNTEFVARASLSPILQKKYDFFAKKIWKEGEFIGTTFSNAPIPPYFWDTTKLSISEDKYLYYLK